MRDGTRATDDAAAAIAFANGLAGETLLGADAILDEVRRGFWWVSYSGEALDVACAALGVSDKARSLLVRLEGRTVAEFDFFLAQVRAFLWAQTFATLPESRFARETAAAPPDGDARLH